MPLQHQKNAKNLLKTSKKHYMFIEMGLKNHNYLLKMSYSFKRMNQEKIFKLRTFHT